MCAENRNQRRKEILNQGSEILEIRKGETKLN